MSYLIISVELERAVLFWVWVISALACSKSTYRYLTVIKHEEGEKQLDRPNSQTCMEWGQWLWLSWQKGRFRYQMSAVQIQTLANFNRTFIYCQLYCIEKTKIKEKEPAMAHLKKHVWMNLCTFFGFNKNTTAFRLGRYILHLLLLKSSPLISLVNY